MTSAIPHGARCASLPDAEAIHRTLHMLVGRRLDIQPVNSRRASLLPVTATFVDTTTNEVVAICTSDYEFAASTGAALALIPAGQVKQSLKAGGLNEALQENAYEIFNIISIFYNDNPPIHVKLDVVYYSEGEVPLEVRKAMRKPVAWCDFTIGVQGYLPGKVSFVVF